MPNAKPSPARERVLEAYNRLNGNQRAVARETGLNRKTVYEHLKNAGLTGPGTKPLTGGTVDGTETEPAVLPVKGKVKRYIVTSAQNNTKVHAEFWKNLQALAKHYDAELLIGTFTYNQNAFGQLSVKQGTKAERQKELWYDDAIKPFICDTRKALANGLVFCGEINIMPTAVDPLSGMEVYTQRHSSIFPHAKVRMMSVAAMKNDDKGTKLMYTTGTVTLRNYIQKKEGQKASFHHVYGALIVEVTDEGHWFVRQLNAGPDDEVQDLNVMAKDGKCFADMYFAESITWGDLHATTVDPIVKKLSMDMLDTLLPKYQFIHDMLEGVSINHHASNNPHDLFKAYLRGYDVVSKELKDTAAVMAEYHRPHTKMVVVDSNHDNWLGRWLREHDYRKTPQNAILFLELQLAMYNAMETKDKKFNLIQAAMTRFEECPKGVVFLHQDESFTTCGGKIENGMHGHLGVNGARGTPMNLSKVGKKANTGHTHVAEIRDGLYVAGTSTTLDMSYNKGPSGWTHSHILTYPNGKRTLVTCYAGKWRA